MAQYAQTLLFEGEKQTPAVGVEWCFNQDIYKKNMKQSQTYENKT